MISLFVAALLAADPGAAGASAGPSSLDRVICRVRPSTGSRLRSVRTCMTQREWNERREQITRGMRDYTTREMASQPPPPISPGSN